MPDLLAKQIADAMIARVATISGIGETSIEPRRPENVATFPAAFVMGLEENKEPRNLGPMAAKWSTLDVVIGFYVKDLAPLTALCALCKSIQDVIQATPENFGMTGVSRPFVTETQLFRAGPPLSDQLGIGHLTVQVKYNEPYGAA
jgi:hypothetical protein